MKARDIKELHTKDITALRVMLKETREALITARLEFGQQKLTNTTSLANLRRDIARIQTVMQLKAIQLPIDAPEGKEKNEKKEVKTKTNSDKGGKK
jgi:ribosomal protein L29